MKKITEEESIYKDLEEMSVNEILENINHEDHKVAEAVKRAIPQIRKLVSAIVPHLKNDGRLFYIGAGTSGRLGVLDASECPPTFGVSPDKVIGIIAGGDEALRKAIEFAEDDLDQAWKDLSSYHVNTKDVVVGIASSGSTPYVLGGLTRCKENNVTTGCIVCNTDSVISKVAQYPVEAVVGPEFISGSTRMKAGTAQKLILNMISTSVMIKLGRVKGNKMVDMQISNNKLKKRAVKMIMESTGKDKKTAQKLLEIYQSVRKAIENGAGNSSSFRI
jgi:N-acetylmuramic acid 6-phosphate etherase